MISRRTFLAGTAVTPLLLSAGLTRAYDETETRVVFDGVTGEAVPDAKLIFKRIGGRGRFVFRTDNNGIYNFGLVPASITAPTKFRVRIMPASLKNKFAAVDIAMVITPLERKNAKIGNFGLLPLQSPGPKLGLANSYFENNWLDLVKSTLFAQEFQQSGIARGVNPGAVLRFSTRRIKVRISTGFKGEEYQFVREEIERALRFYTDGIYNFKFSSIAAKNVPLESTMLQEGNIYVNRSTRYPRPAVDINPKGNNADTLENPNEISSAIIQVDEHTIATLFNKNNGSSEDIAFARSLLQRCVAGILGWRPTIKLPGQSIIDENTYPPENRLLPGYSDYDRALAKAISGGGTGCYPAGTRFARNKTKVILKGDINFPLNAQHLIA
jgi:hypothetical protein